MANIWRRYPSNRLVSRAFVKQSLYSSTENIATEFWESSTSNVYTLTAQQGSYAVTGTSSNLLHHRLLVGINGSYNITGQNATLLKHRNLAVSAGTYTSNGQSVTITHIGSSAVYTLTCTQGNYSINGQSVTILKHRNLTGQTGQYNLTGQSVSIIYTPIGGVYWPLPSQVLLGVYYGPNGNDYVGTLNVYGLKYDITTGKLIKPINDKVVMTL